MKDLRRLRTLDRHIGTILCLIFSFLHKLRPKIRPRTVKNILVIELFEMGASLMSYPALRYISENLDNPNIYCLTTRQMRESWELLHIIPPDRIIAIDDRNMFRFLKSAAEAIARLRKLDINRVIDFELFMRISAIISFLVKSDLRAGFCRYEMEGLYRGSFYDICSSYNQNSHIAKNILALTKASLSLSDDHPNFKGTIDSSELKLLRYISKEDVRMSVLNKIVDIYPTFSSTRTKIFLMSPDVGPNLPMRNYPADFFAEIASGLLSKLPDHVLLFIGTEDSRAACSSIHKKVNNDRCINFCGMTTFQELMELLAMADLLISNDHGPAHFASATGTNTLAIFGAESPFVYGPLGNCVAAYSFFQCSPCLSAYNHKNTGCTNNACLKVIQPAEIIALAIDILDGRTNFRTINNTVPYI